MKYFVLAILLTSFLFGCVQTKTDSGLSSGSVEVQNITVSNPEVSAVLNDSVLDSLSEDLDSVLNVSDEDLVFEDLSLDI